MPCAHPTTFTAMGRPAQYFKGMAMQSNTRKEIPSARPTRRKRVIEREAAPASFARSSFMTSRRGGDQLIGHLCPFDAHVREPSLVSGK